MNYAKIRNNDIANGEGVRTSLFVSGCTNRCPGCFNQEAWDFQYGTPFTVQTSEEIYKMVSEPTISGLSILGGDPLCQSIQGMILLSELCRRVRQLGKTVWLWTGFIWEDIFFPKSANLQAPYQQLLLSDCDVVVDGPFKQELADRRLVWKGSANQRVIDVQASLKVNTIILH
jgi:anaerobic ribonucleoside-triphosphate reductase activating protein